MTTDELKELLKSIQKINAKVKYLNLNGLSSNVLNAYMTLYQVSQIKIRAEQFCSEFMKKTTTKKWVFTIRRIFRKK